MKTIAIVKYVFALIGAGLLAGALYWYAHTQDFIKSALTTEGTVIDLVRSESSDSTTYRPVVKFSIPSGKVIEFVSSTGSSPPSFSRGETVEVLYQEDFPEKAKISNFFSLWGGAAIIGGLGLVFFAIGFSIICFDIRNRNKIEYLKKNGTPVKAKFQSVGLNRRLKAGGKSPYQITAQWKNPATAELHIFSSENIWFDPADHIKSEEITVLIDRRNPKKYHVDISFLPAVAR